MSKQTTMDRAVRLAGDLTLECAAAVTAVLQALDKKRAPEDDRTAGQRYHDALQEGCAPWPRVCVICGLPQPRQAGDMGHHPAVGMCCKHC